MANGRYQSRVFNLVAQQSLRLRSQSAQAFRRVKLATVWGVQILLYPIYVGFQSTRLLGKQLQQTSRQALPRLRSAQRFLQSGLRSLPASLPAADTPIQNLLQAVSILPVSPQLQERLLQWGHQPAPKSLGSSGLQPLTEPTSLPLGASGARYTGAKQTEAIQLGQVTLAEIPTVQIRAIASLLPTGNLVLVTSENQILDILSFEQQTQLTRQMAWETANYGRQRRLYTPPLIPSPFVSRFLPPVPQSPHALPPIRVLQKIMGWMQRGSVAISADLFAESQLAIYYPPALALPGDAETALRSAQPSWVMMEVQFYDWLEQTGETATDLLLKALKSGTVTFQQVVERFVERREQEAPGTFEATLDATLERLNPSQIDPGKLDRRLPTPTRPLMPTLPSLPARLKKWDEVLDRWLSKIPGLKTDPDSLPAAKVTPQPPQPWLTMEDLFGASSRQISSQPDLLPASTPTPFNALPSAPAPRELSPRELSPDPSIPAIPVPTTNRIHRWVNRSLRQILPSAADGDPAENPASWELIDTAALETAIKTKLTKFRQPPLKPDAKPNSPANRLGHPLPSPVPNPVQESYPIEPVQKRELQPTPLPFDPYDDDLPPLTSLDTANQEEDALLPQNWLETEAQLVEYVKHPLERLLEWLDRGMVWLEERILDVWRWLNRPIR